MSVDFLLDRGSDIIRYRTANELVKDITESEIKEYRDSLLQDDRVKKRLLLISSKEKINDFNGIHGSTEHHLENSLMMAKDYGIDTSIEEFSLSVESIRDRLMKQVFEEGHVFYSFPHMIITPLLYVCGDKNPWVVEHIRKRIETIYSFTKDFNYDIYDRVNKYGGVPKAYSGRSIVKPELYKNGDMKFPIIYDLYGFSEYQKECSDETKRKIDEIIKYILDERYYDIERGYGILHNGGYRYLAMGWDCKLPNNENDTLTPLTLKRLELMSNFKRGIESQWFQRNMEIVNSYKTDRGTWIFPKEALKDSKGFWISGHRMAIGENRRCKGYDEIESTFRVLKIKKNIQKMLG